MPEMTEMSELREQVARVLAEPLCAAICDLLGEPRILVPGEVAALLARPHLADALLPLIREREAAAWEEGYAAGSEDEANVYPQRRAAANPYRDEQREGQ